MSFTFRLFWWRLWKWIVHIFTCKCEIERICRWYRRNQGPEYDVTLSVHTSKTLESSIWLSKQLSHTHAALRTADFEPEELSLEIGEKKKIPRTPENIDTIYRTLEMCLTRIRDLNRLLEDLSANKTLYDSNNDKHEAMLDGLWYALEPNRERTERITPLWTRIGFQGTDPATDFRSMGLLGLQNLLYFAQTWPNHARHVLADTQQQNWFSFAITGLNITAALCRLVAERRLNGYFYTRGCSLTTFNDLYAYIFVQLNDRWRYLTPANVMAFPEVFKNLLTDIVHQDQTDYLATQELSGRVPQTPSRL